MFSLLSMPWLHLWVSGWVIGSLQGATRHGSRMWQSQSPSLRTPLLSAQIKHLTLNANAPMQRKKAEAHNVRWLRG